MCHKKVYNAWEHASHDAKELRGKYEGRTTVYKCRKCGGWHVGTVLVSPPKKIYKREKLDRNILFG